MKKITELNFDNTYRELPEDFYEVINPTPFKNPHLVAFNNDVSKLIDLDINEKNTKPFVEFLSGKKIVQGEEPIALYYTGHQFGVYNKDIGDGRAILLGEIRNDENVKWDLHLKGAGKTKFSRQFDGRAVLRSTIREYLCSEAVYYLGIPTTRALCIIGSDEIVYREKKEYGAMMIRVAETHVRFGSFEGFYYGGKHENLKILVDYVIDNYYQEIKNENDKYNLFLTNVAEQTAKLIAYWQAFGFTHGVMNTDNMSVIGLTLDYGTFGFMEKFDFDYTPNHSDYFGRYSYKNQPSIALWNLNKLVKCIKTVASNGNTKVASDVFKKKFFEFYTALMRKKLGLYNNQKEDKKFIQNTLEILEKYKVDYATFFRQLSNFKKNKSETYNDYLNRLSATSLDLNGWFSSYKKRLEKENLSDAKRKKLMDKTNPKYILRNYIAEEVIRKAEDKQDYDEIEKVRNIFKNPFDEQPEYENYAKESPQWANNLIISCSS